MVEWRERVASVLAVAVVLLAGASLAAGIRTALFDAAPVRAGSFSAADVADLLAPGDDAVSEEPPPSTTTTTVPADSSSTTTAAVQGAVTTTTAARDITVTTTRAPVVTTTTTTSTTVAGTNANRGRSEENRGKGKPADD